MNDQTVYVTNIVTIAGKDYRIIGKNDAGYYLGVNVITGIIHHISPTLIRYAELLA